MDIGIRNEILVTHPEDIYVGRANCLKTHNIGIVNMANTRYAHQNKRVK
jgi:hypothetical protein